MSNKFIQKYLKNFEEVFSKEKKKYLYLNDVCEKIKKLKKTNKILIFGNGGSAPIASHFSLDLSNNTKIKCLNFNDPGLITCFSNDYGYENWVDRCIKIFSLPGDLIIFISSSGNSLNMTKAAKNAKKSNNLGIVTFTGFSKNNKLKKIGHLNLWVDSNNYNYIENIHQIWLLAIVDTIKNSLGIK
ncbi:SIS domain-containing protein [Candidatus Pelagibacter sp.]|uniref:SIS domain-containing protein n=1 Tax=Candidatus Pelagibacter sp. TaxID=2024849 RepID=UPI003D13A788